MTKTAKKRPEMFAGHPVFEAIWPLRMDAEDSAEAAARRVVAYWTAELEKTEWSLAPFRAAAYDNTQGWNRREVARRDYNTICRLTERTEATSYMLEDKAKYQLSPRGVEHFVKSYRDAARAQYELYVMKMVGKVGDCCEAAITGNHVWGESYLLVTKGSFKELWKTQQIRNTSKLGNDYPQWPSRLSKKGDPEKLFAFHKGEARS